MPNLKSKDQTLPLPELIAEALTNNPEVLAAYNNWMAEEQKIAQAGSLPDPMANFAYFGDSVETREGPQEAIYGLAQKVPFPGKSALKTKTARKQAEMLKEKYEAVERAVIKQVKFSYYDI